jgi:hypothetical protein
VIGAPIGSSGARVMRRVSNCEETDQTQNKLLDHDYEEQRDRLL